MSKTSRLKGTRSQGRLKGRFKPVGKLKAQLEANSSDKKEEEAAQ